MNLGHCLNSNVWSESPHLSKHLRGRQGPTVSQRGRLRPGEARVLTPSLEDVLPCRQRTKRRWDLGQRSGRSSGHTRSFPAQFPVQLGPLPGKCPPATSIPCRTVYPLGLLTQVTPKGAVRTGDTGSQGDRRWTLFSRPVNVEADCVRMWSLMGPGRGVGPGVVRLQQLDARCSKASLGEPGGGGGLESGKMMSTVLTMLDLQPLGACDGSGGWGLCVWFEAQ